MLRGEANAAALARAAAAEAEATLLAQLMQARAEVDVLKQALERSEVQRVALAAVLPDEMEAQARPVHVHTHAHVHVHAHVSSCVHVSALRGYLMSTFSVGVMSTSLSLASLITAGQR